MKIIFSILFITFSLSFFGQEKRCAEVKNGIFKYFDSQSDIIFIKRIDSIQIDSSSTYNMVFHSKIKWKSDCDYEMTIYKVNDSLFNPIIGNTFKVKILNVDDRRIKIRTWTLNGEKALEYYMDIIE